MSQLIGIVVVHVLEGQSPKSDPKEPLRVYCFVLEYGEEGIE